MQAFILTCLLCLQTQLPCDSNQSPSSLEDPSCSQCFTGLSGNFNLTNSSDITQAINRNLTDSSELGKKIISAEFKENLGDLFVDMKAIVQEMKGNPDDIYGMINKIKNDMNQVFVVSGPSSEKHDRTALNFPSQKSSLEKISEKLSQFVDENDNLQRKLSIMQTLVLNGEAGEKRDSLRKGDRLMIGESLVSQNGKYRWNFELGTADSVIYDEEGKEVKRQNNCFVKPIGSNINIFMNQTLELYWDIWHGKSANEACFYGLPMPCVELHSNCFVKLDNDGHVKLFTSHGEAVDTYI